MKNTFTSILIILLNISLFGTYCLGIVHSFKKHGIAEGAIGTILFPWAMYRGLEFWWHDDYGDVNWDKRLPNDMQTCFYFLNAAIDKNVDKYQLNENLEKFSKKIKNYPPDKKQYLMDGTEKYIKYNSSLYNDFLNSLKIYKKNGSYNLTRSDTTIKLETEISKLNLNEDIEIFKKSFMELNRQMRNNLPRDTSQIDYDKIDEFETGLKYELELQQIEFKRIYNSLFDKEL